MAAPRMLTLILCLCLAAICLGPSILVSHAGESPRLHDLSAPASDSMTFLAARDAWINADAVQTTYGSLEELWVGINTFSGKMDQRQALVGFDISALPADAIVDSAALELTQTGHFSSQPCQIWPYQVTAAWEEYTVTWANRPASASAGDPPATLDATLGVETWDVTRIVQAWQAGAENHGILLTGDGVTAGARVFASRESTSVPGRLTITYHRPGDTPTPTETLAVAPTHTETPTPTATEMVMPTHTPTGTLTVTPTATATARRTSSPTRRPTYANSFYLPLVVQ